MSFPRRFFHRAIVNVPVEIAWDVFTDHERMGEYTGSECRITKPGEDERNGLGCIRQINVEEHGMPDVDEVINHWVPNKLFGYHVTAGAPISHHQGLVRFFVRGPRQTQWIYDMRLKALPEILTMVPDFYDLLDASFRQFMADAEAECERRGAEGLFSVSALPALLTEAGGQLSN